jgi:hypothetical protein
MAARLVENDPQMLGLFEPKSDKIGTCTAAFVYQVRSKKDEGFFYTLSSN